MGDNSTDGNKGSGVPAWPPPATAMRIMSFAFGGGAAIAGFLGYCDLAAILALLSLVFNLWDFFQSRGAGRPKGDATGGGPGRGYSETGAQGSTAEAPGRTDRPDRY